jgi:hypothetical protein
MRRKLGFSFGFLAEEQMGFFFLQNWKRRRRIKMGGFFFWQKLEDEENTKWVFFFCKNWKRRRRKWVFSFEKTGRGGGGSKLQKKGKQ